MTKWNQVLTHALAFSVLVGAFALPPAARGQSLGDLDKALSHRQDKKNEWRNIALASGAVAILGLLNKDSTLTFAGTIGALYSANRYEQDRKSQSKLARTRASYFSRESFYRNGVRYDRHTKWKKGKKYYYFQKVKQKK